MSPSPDEPTDETIQWQTRFERAVHMLDDMQQLAALAQMIVQINALADPTARSVMNGEMLAQARRVGLLAGSYNPLTLAHIALTQAARQTARLDTLVWAEATVTVDKERVQRASLPDRLTQVMAYIGSQQSARPSTAPDALAIFNHGLYVEQAQALRRLLAPEAELTIIVGFDKIVQILDPRYYADRAASLGRLFGLARLLVAPRAGQGAEALAALLAQPDNHPYAPSISFCPLDPQYTTDSSSEARALAASMTPNDILHSPQLRRLLPPEGMALAHTGAYTPVTDAASDPYARRGARATP